MNDKNEQRHGNEPGYHINYRFTYLKLVRINKTLESLISATIRNYDEIGIDMNSISLLHEFKNCLCEAISEHIIRHGNSGLIVEPFILITNDKQYQEFN